MKDVFKLNLLDLNDTEKLARKIAIYVKPNTFISIRGKLGIGKTTLAGLIINSLSKKKIRVLSPTFSLVNIYDLEKVKVWHFDLYRLKDKQEIFDLDFDVALMDCVIMEWPEIIEDYLPNKRVDIFMNEDKNFLRSVTVKKIN
tara:strand:+ start:48 stop:476 length:429 start_codon:yes stop_codon:yes gene_type:complete